MGQEEKLCNEVQAVIDLAYLGVRVNTGGHVRLLRLPEQDAVGLSVRSVLSCCMEGDFI